MERLRWFEISTFVVTSLPDGHVTKQGACQGRLFSREKSCIPQIACARVAAGYEKPFKSLKIRKSLGLYGCAEKFGLEVPPGAAAHAVPRQKRQDADTQGITLSQIGSKPNGGVQVRA
jgi:hypothetical protein